MRRSKFLLTIMAILPLASFGKIKDSIFPERKGFKVNAGEGKWHGHLILKGVNSNIIDVKVSGKDTDGALAIFEQIGLSPKRGTPLHIHPFQDEIFKIIEGEYHFQVGEDRHQLKAGDTIFLPRNVPHAWTQISERGKTNVIVQPAGKLEEFFVTISALEGEPTKEQVDKIFSENEMKVVGPPMTVQLVFLRRA